MDKVQALTEKAKVLTSEKILGIQEIKVLNYTFDEVRAIKQELARYAGAKNENISETTVSCWLLDFQELQMPVTEVIKRIRLAKHQKKFGITEFAIFMNVNLSEYKDFYEHEKKEIPEPRTVPYGKAIPLYNHFRDLQKPEYEIIDELPPDKDSAEGYVLIRDDKSYSVFYSKENFKIKQG